MAGGGGGGGGAGAALGGMSNIDFTFGQKGVYDDRTKKELAMLMGLIGASAGAGSKSVNQGQTPGAAPIQSWNPGMLISLARLFGVGGGMGGGRHA